MGRRLPRQARDMAESPIGRDPRDWPDVARAESIAMVWPSRPARPDLFGQALGKTPWCSRCQAAANTPPLSEEQILAWADAYFAAQGKWPSGDSGPIPGTTETWAAVASAIRAAGRGLRCRSSLAQLLARRRGARNRKRLPPLTEQRILAWAGAHLKATGRWPTCNDGPITQSPGDTWGGVDQALSNGHRGLPGGSSLAKLLAERRGTRNRKCLPPLEEQQILAWATAYHEATGQRPNCRSGAIPQSGGETWMAVESALTCGHRGLPGGSSLAKLLRKHGLT